MGGDRGGGRGAHVGDGEHSGAARQVGRAGGDVGRMSEAGLAWVGQRGGAA